MKFFLIEILSREFGRRWILQIDANNFLRMKNNKNYIYGWYDLLKCHKSDCFTFIVVPWLIYWPTNWFFGILQ